MLRQPARSVGMWHFLKSFVAVWRALRPGSYPSSIEQKKRHFLKSWYTYVLTLRDLSRSTTIKCNRLKQVIIGCGGGFRHETAQKYHRGPINRGTNFKQEYGPETGLTAAHQILRHLHKDLAPISGTLQGRDQFPGWRTLSFLTSTTLDNGRSPSPNFNVESQILQVYNGSL